MAWINGQADRIIYKQWIDSSVRRYWDRNHNYAFNYTAPVDENTMETYWIMACCVDGCFQCATIHNAAFGAPISAKRAIKMFEAKGWYEDWTDGTGKMYCQLHTPIKEENIVS